jgi:putative addiction module CopG family antidote
MAIHLPADIEAAIREKVAAGRFEDEADVVRAGLRLLEMAEQRERAQLKRLRTLVRAGFESGGDVEFSDELMDELEREADDAFRQGERPDPDVCP